MEKRLLDFVEENELCPFNKIKTPLRPVANSVYKTRDAKAVYNKVLSKFSSNFVFADSSNLFSLFDSNANLEEIKFRQNFFKKIKDMGKKDNSFLKNLVNPKSYWKPDYDIVVVTESSETFNELKKRGCPVQLLISENDVLSLSERDVVQVYDCSEYGMALERLPQAIFLNSIDEAYLERYLEILSGWEENLRILKDDFSQSEIIKLNDLLSLISENENSILDKETVELKVEEINQKINERLKQLTLSGDSVIALLNKGAVPDSLKEVINSSVHESGLDSKILNLEIPVSIDYEELESLIQKQSAMEFSSRSEKIKNFSDDLIKIPKKIEELSRDLILFDFISGISQFITDYMNFPEFSENLIVNNSKNIFLENAQPINFNLTNDVKCSMLTGANSGGKTTLIEHVIQLTALFSLGLSVLGDVRLPIFSEIYYFAKNKGSMSKGAFETLLTQMSKISAVNKTLILADEIEAVTEPGVSGIIISATAN